MYVYESRYIFSYTPHSPSLFTDAKPGALLKPFYRNFVDFTTTARDACAKFATRINHDDSPAGAVGPAVSPGPARGEISPPPYSLSYTLDAPHKATRN